MKYTITHRTAAAAIAVTDPEGRQHFCYYMADNKPVQEGVSGTAEMAEARFRALPWQVREAVTQQFREVFALHISFRAAWVKAQVPFEVEV